MTTRTFNGSISSLAVLPGDGGDLGGDQVSAGPSGVASMARGGQILNGVIGPVSVDMIDHQIQGTCDPFGPDLPGDQFFAPVTWMGAGSNDIEKNYPVDAYSPASWRQGMIGAVNATSILDPRGVRLNPLVCVPTCPGAVNLDTPLVCGGASLEIGSTVMTREMGHGAHVTKRGAC